MKALTPIFCTRVALMLPTHNPTSNATVTAAGAPTLSMVLRESAAARAATDAMDRSKLPEISTTVMKMARIASGAACPRMLEALTVDRYAGCPRTAVITARTTNRSTSAYVTPDRCGRSTPRRGRSGCRLLPDIDRACSAVTTGLPRRQ